MTVLDHTGHFIADEPAARRALEALGFAVTPVSVQSVPDPETGGRKPTGTGNICVMLEEGYLELLLHTADTELGREFRATLARRAGLHLLAFGEADAEARHAALSAAGFAMRPLARFARPVETETGEIMARFTVARLERDAMPEGRVQFATHHTPEALWQPRWMAHPNGARALRAALIAAPDPDAAAARYAALLGRPVVAGRIELERGALEFMGEGEAATLAGAQVDPGRSALAGLRIAVADLADMERRAAACGLPSRRMGDALAVPFDPALGGGFWLFEAG
ncbi:VOC family protein [Seohaeicola nanhaiensis]|uniref:VOC family protein n=1 Tax=Seohaeicola nanhaiensis TaxID=1387282 RepID=A0ABV9KEY8_9RHOB